LSVVFKVNEALHDLYVEDEDFSSLKQSVTEYDGFEQVRNYTRNEWGK
jgi:hypothetical protein